MNIDQEIKKNFEFHVIQMFVYWNFTAACTCQLGTTNFYSAIRNFLQAWVDKSILDYFQDLSQDHEVTTVFGATHSLLRQAIWNASMYDVVRAAVQRFWPQHAHIETNKSNLWVHILPFMTRTNLPYQKQLIQLLVWFAAMCTCLNWICFSSATEVW